MVEMGGVEPPDFRFWACCLCQFGYISLVGRVGFGPTGSVETGFTDRRSPPTLPSTDIMAGGAGFEPADGISRLVVFETTPLHPLGQPPANTKYWSGGLELNQDSSLYQSDALPIALPPDGRL